MCPTLKIFTLIFVCFFHKIAICRQNIEGPMGIFSYTESIMHVYMNHNGHSSHNVRPHMPFHAFTKIRQTDIQRERIVKYTQKKEQAFHSIRPTPPTNLDEIHQELCETQPHYHFGTSQNDSKGKSPTSTTPKMVMSAQPFFSHALPSTTTHDIRDNEEDW